MPTVETRDFPAGYRMESSSVYPELAAVQEMMIPPMMSRQESAREDMIVYDELVDMARAFPQRSIRFRPKEQ